MKCKAYRRFRVRGGKSEGNVEVREEYDCEETEGSIETVRQEELEQRLRNRTTVDERGERK